MIADVRAVVVGVASSLLAPLWLSGKRLESLTREPSPASAADDGDRAAEIRLAHRTSDRMMSLLPRPFWRNSCLYRSIAQCLMLRWYAVPATVVVGVRRAGEKVQAHAWVAVRGVPFPGQSAEVEHNADCEGAGAFQPLVAADSRSRS